MTKKVLWAIAVGIGTATGSVVYQLIANFTGDVDIGRATFIGAFTAFVLLMIPRRFIE